MGKDITEKVSSLIWQCGFVDAIRSCGEIVSMALSSGDEEKVVRGSRVNVVNWKELLETGIGVLRMTPEEFWGLTMIEFASACDSSEDSIQGNLVPQCQKMNYKILWKGILINGNH